jgi:hypothetical protein
LIPSLRVPETCYASGCGDTFTAAGQDIAVDTDLACVKSSAQASMPLLTWSAARMPPAIPYANAAAAVDRLG